MMARGLGVAVLSALGLALAAGTVAAAEVPQATQKILADTKLPEVS